MTAVDTKSSNNTVPVIGYGALGREIVTQLLAAGRQLQVIQRSKPKDLPPGTGFVATDIMDPTAITAATTGAKAIICALRLLYFSDFELR